MPKPSFSIVVVGGAVVDVQATPAAAETRRGGSVPGKVVHTPGGVGRNIAQGIAGITGQPEHVLLIATIGTDAAGDLLVSHSARLRRGEVTASVADVAAVENHLGPDVIQRHACHIQAATLLVLDANLSAPAIAAACHLASAAGVAVFFEPVSVAKSTRCLDVICLLSFISPNIEELVALANGVRKARGQADIPFATTQLSLSADVCLRHLLPHMSTLLEAGVRGIVLTMGPLGAAYIDAVGTSVRAQHMPALPAAVVNLSGAGDALVAGMVSRLVMQMPPAESLAAGMAAAKCAVQSEENVPSHWDRAQLHRDAQQACAARQTMQLTRQQSKL